MPASPRVRAICVGQAESLPARDAGGRTVPVVSGIAKRAVSTLDRPEPIEIGPMGVAGDTVVDLSVHGGRDQAVYLYPVEHYAFWQTVRAQAGHPGPLEPGQLGENLLVEGLLEPSVWIGDRLHLGEVELRVESPRSPCFKFNARMGFDWASSMMNQSGYTGFYCSVVRQGRLAAGAAIDVFPGERVVTIEQRHRLRHGHRPGGRN